jgi:hypothetical protein
MKKFRQHIAEEELGSLRRHPKWDSDRYEKLKINGLTHFDIMKKWDEEVAADKEAEKAKEKKK